MTSLPLVRWTLVAMLFLGACGGDPDSDPFDLDGETLSANTLACATDDVCPCGSDCTNGFCTAVGPTCTSNADCPGGMRCKDGRKHGQECGRVCQVDDSPGSDDSRRSGSLAN